MHWQFTGTERDWESGRFLTVESVVRVHHALPFNNLGSSQMSNVTKEGIEVTPGQRWMNLDKRMGGRVVKVLSVEDGKARVSSWGIEKYATRLSIRRMHKHSTGWALVTEASDKDVA